jgi:hypothetical protein
MSASEHFAYRRTPRNDDDSGPRPVSLQNRAAWRHLYGGNAACVQHEKPVTVSAAKHASGFSKR